MFRGRRARAGLASVAVVLLALLFSAAADPFTSAHTLSEATAKAETGTTPPEQPVRDAADLAARGPASRCAREHPLITGRAAGTGPSPTPGTAHGPVPRASGTHAPAALQVFRC
ncbi:hypothetical protein ACIBJF_24635 [Streptomyces sp. NPDC050743]|uniref:hypothetical protein n=1 Tax=Streptomyces sp. NPDC050743 TaxID=3365634 RepID=UPI0037890741